MLVIRVFSGTNWSINYDHASENINKYAVLSMIMSLLSCYNISFFVKPIILQISHYTNFIRYSIPQQSKQRNFNFVLGGFFFLSEIEKIWHEQFFINSLFAFEISKELKLYFI